MAQASWGSTTAKGGGGGSADPNVLKLQDTNRIRLLEPGAVKWRQHFIESVTDPEQGRSVVCPKGADGRDNNPCPLCMKPVNAEGNQRFAISRRFATNVYDYESGSVKILIGGPQIFEDFDAVAAVGIDPTEADFLINKMGKGKSTSYKVVRGGSDPLPKQIGPEDLHDLSKYDTPTSVEKIFELLEEMGVDYDSLEMPSYTLDEAEAVQMPYGKHKGMTIEQLVANDLDYAMYIYRSKRDQGSYGDPIFVAMHTVLEARGEVEPLDEVPAAPPKPASGATTTTQSTPASTPAQASTVTLVGPDGTLGEFPAQAKDALLAAGYTEPKDEPTSEGVVTLVGPDGNTVEVPQAAADALLAAGFTKVGAEPEPEGPSFTAPSDDDQVSFKLRVVPTPVPMAWKDAKALYVKGEGDFQGNDGDHGEGADEFLRSLCGQDVEQAAHPAAVAEAAAADPTSPGGQSSASDSSSLDPTLAVQGEDGRWTHPALDKDYANKGGVTQALNRLAKSAPAATASGNGSASAPPANTEGREGKLEVAKTLLAQQPALKDDFNKLLEMFQEVAGKRNISDFTEPELDKLIERLQSEAAVA